MMNMRLLVWASDPVEGCGQDYEIEIPDEFWRRLFAGMALNAVGSWSDRKKAVDECAKFADALLREMGGDDGSAS